MARALWIDLALGSRDPLTYLLYGRHLLTRLQGRREADRGALAERAAPEP